MTVPRDELSALIGGASAVDQDRTRRTREMLLRLLLDFPDPSRAALFLRSFTIAHDAFEAAIFRCEPGPDIEAARQRCLDLLSEYFPPSLH